MKLFTFLINLFKNNNVYNHGLAPDLRTAQEKALDYTHDEVSGSVILDWKDKPESEWKQYTPREQNGSLSCCGQSAAKAIEIIDGDIWSAHPIYRRRSNFPSGGMYLQNLGDISKKRGTCLEKIDPSQWLGESKLNLDVTVDTPKKVAAYIQFDTAPVIEQIAEAIELYKHCIIIVHCNKSEWTAVPENQNLSVNFGHCITAVDYFTKDGKKYILIEDSTGHFNTYDKTQQRLLSEDFIKAKVVGGLYFVPASPAPVAPTYTFTKTLTYGLVSNDVKMLQDKLKSLGFFPAGIPSTGKFYAITLNAVKKFQTAHNLKPDGVVGPMTNAILNQ